MRTITRPAGGATVIAVSTSTGLITRGGPGVCTARHGAWEIIVDDFERGSTSPRRLRRILVDCLRDPIEAVLRHFDAASSELFAVVGPPGVVAGSGPRAPGGAPVAVWVEPAEGFVALGFAELIEERREGWPTLPSGIAVCWGPSGPEACCDLATGTTRLWAAAEAV